MSIGKIIFYIFAMLGIFVACIGLALIILGIGLTSTIIGAILGIPLIFIGLIIFFLSIKIIGIGGFASGATRIVERKIQIGIREKLSYCSDCGRKLQKGSNYCPVCGLRIKSSA